MTTEELLQETHDSLIEIKTSLCGIDGKGGLIDDIKNSKEQLNAVQSMVTERLNQLPCQVGGCQVGYTRKHLYYSAGGGGIASAALIALIEYLLTHVRF